MSVLRLGAGAGFSGDRIDPAIDLAERGSLDFLVFECLAERTIALAQQARLADPSVGYDPLLAARSRAVHPACRRNGVRIVTNMGAANPEAAARRTCEIAAELGIAGLKVAAVAGDDVLQAVRDGGFILDELGCTANDLGERLVSANAYTGARPIVSALEMGADVVITGRAADPALFMGPLIHRFGWAMDDWTRLRRGALCGHLLECAGQITGGYFADPGYKDVPDLARLGMPIGEVGEDGDLTITKLDNTGGAVTEATCKEQLLYEVQDPTRYFQPDVIADFSNVGVESVGRDRVRISGGDGAPKTGQLKVSVGYRDGFIGEGQISYAGPGAEARGRLAIAILEERMRVVGLSPLEVRGELIGVDSVLGSGLATSNAALSEVRARFATRMETREEAERVAAEVDAMYLNGPAGGGGVTKSVREVIAVASTLIPEALSTPSVTLMES